MPRSRPLAMLSGALLVLAACGEQQSADSATASKPAAAPGAGKAAASAQPADWTKVYAATPEGGFRIGNPDAPVKLIEYASLTCPHCRDFHKAAHDKLVNTYVAGGRVSYEYRNFVLNGPDLAMSVLARCEGKDAFFPLLDSVYGTQDQWIQPFINGTPADQEKIRAMPADRQLLGIADQGGLDRFYKLRGMPRAKYEACLTNKANVDQLQKMRDEGIKKFNVSGTPSFVMNGEPLSGMRGWPDVEAAIESRLR